MLQVLVVISQKFCYRKEAWAMQKLFIKRKKEREKKRSWEKIDKCLRYLKQWVLWCPHEKREKEMDNIAHVFLQKDFQVSKER